MLKFTKMHGLGNDYVYIDCVTKNLEVNDISSLAQFISNRNFGIGSDGLILIHTSKIADFRMQMLNSDGTEAEMCGNGIRCVGKFVYDKGLTKKEEIAIETIAGIKKLKLNISENKVETITVDMGEPILEANKIPVLVNKTPVINLNVEEQGKKFSFTCISMGNPHAVTEVENLDELEIEKYGRALETNKYFPNKSNIEFIKIIDRDNIKMRVWERGAGETLACGTGACAVVVAMSLNNLINKKAKVELLGGTLQVEWNDSDNHVYMTGPATTVFEGEIEYNKN